MENKDTTDNSGEQDQVVAPQTPQTSAPSAGPTTTKKPKNTIGILGLAFSVLGFICAVIPGLMIVGWVLLPAAFVLGVVALAMRTKPIWMGLTAVGVSVVGTLVGIIAFLVFVADSVDEVLSGTEVTSSTPNNSTDAQEDEGEGESTGGGTRENPLPLGSTISDDDWTVTINSVNLNANKVIASENPFNDPPPDGYVYILVNVTAKYTGSDPQGETPWVSISYVTPEGNTIESFDSFIVAPDSFDDLETLYSGASTTGNFDFAVPKATVEKGLLAVEISLFSDSAFVALK